MKNVFLFVIALFITCGRLFAVTVNESDAQTVALNFYSLHTQKMNRGAALSATLKYTHTERDGSVDFYAFDMEPKGFVIVTADDNLEPIIAWSMESYFNPNGAHAGVTYWMNQAGAKIVQAKTSGVQADAGISNLWNTYKNGGDPGVTKSTTIGPLTKSIWNQENDLGTPPPYLYNLFCPFNPNDNQRCVTGCVATAMAQIMYYWQYPATGTGSYSYTYDNTTSGDSYNYGVQSANFGATSYPWSIMPNALTLSTGAQDSAVDLISYQAGVSVAMEYGDDNQGGSGAWVLQNDAGAGNPCAQNSYVTYFGYNPNTIKGVYASSYSSSAWATLLEGELNANRVIEYAGWESNGGGHTWVCDGYETSPSTMFHMNWGWQGVDNGYYAIGKLDPSPYAFNTDDEALIGIEPNNTTSCGTPAVSGTTSITSSSATFKWAAVSGATGYNVQYEIVGATSWTAATTSTDSFSVSGLSSGNNYQWEVQSVCSGGSSSYSAATAFSTTGTSCGVASGLAAGSITGTGATLSWNAVSGDSVYNLEWKASSASSWATVTGLTSTSYPLTGLSSCTAYEFAIQTVCSGGGSSAYSSAVSFSTIGCAISYCASTSTSTTYEYIKNVKLGAINNASVDGHSYVNYTNLSTSLTGSTPNTITLTPGFTSASYDEFWTVYIDYNQNGLFTDAGETVLKINGKTAESGTFAVPATALNGPTRMRIQMQYGAYETNPCATYTYGEVQDFTVNISGNAEIHIGMPDNTDLGSVKLYPNPAQNNLTVQFASDNDGTTRMNIYNITGQRLVNVEKASFTGENIQDINTSALSSGVYIFEIENNGTIQRQKFIIAK